MSDYLIWGIFAVVGLGVGWLVAGIGRERSYSFRGNFVIYKRDGEHKKRPKKWIRLAWRHRKSDSNFRFGECTFENFSGETATITFVKNPFRDAPDHFDIDDGTSQGPFTLKDNIDPGRGSDEYDFIVTVDGKKIDPGVKVRRG